MWDLILKSLLQGTRGCNWILIRILGLGDMIFLPKKHGVWADVNNFDLRIQLNWDQFSGEVREEIIFLGRGGVVSGGVWCRLIGT